MSDETKKPDTPDDDGWGEAAEVAEEVLRPTTELTTSSEWQDPANLTEKVAALRASEQQPQSGPIAQAQDEKDSATDPSAANPSPTENSAAAKAASGASAVGAPLAQHDGDDIPDASYATSGVASDAIEGAPVTMVSDEDAPQWVAQASPEIPTDEQPLPAPSSDMLAAAGILAKKQSDPKSKKRKDPDPRTRGLGLTRKQQVRLIAGAVMLVVAGVVAILGWLNSQNYYLVCGTKSIRAEQGRFWPTGQSSLSGPEFRPIAVPSDARCESAVLESREELEIAFLDALLTQSDRLLRSGGAEQVSVAESQLDQALLLTRGEERSEQREDAKRLQGDVSYWRGAADIQKAIDALQVSADSFSAAAAKRPRHSSDASEWAKHARFIAEEIHKGPRSLREDEAPKEKPHFSGLSDPQLPLKTPQSPEPDPTASELDAGVPTPPPADADVPPIDAALPRGGVLL